MRVARPWTEAEEAFIRDNPELTIRELYGQSGSDRTWDSYRNKVNSMRIDPANEPEELARVKRLGVIADLLERSGIAPEDIGRVEKVRLNEWEGFYKDANDEAQKVHMEAASLILSPKWAEGPAWPVVQPGPSYSVHPIDCDAIHPSGMETCVVLQDAQVGYYYGRCDDLHPTHDEAALDVALQIVSQVKPDRIALNGDWFDFPELSKYRKQPKFVRTTQASVDRLTRFMAQLRSAAPARCRIEWIEGNHEKRASNYIIDNALAAFGLRQGEQPDGWPVMSVPHLCRLDDFGIHYLAGYPAQNIWLSDRLQIVHGDKAGRGANSQRYLIEERVSTIYGHDHRREWAEITKRTRYGPRTILAANPGCLCRVDGVVPGANSGEDVYGQPVPGWENWQQGIAVITYTPGDGPFCYEPVAIHNGEAFYRGLLYKAGCDVEGRLGTDPDIRPEAA